MRVKITKPIPPGFHLHVYGIYKYDDVTGPPGHRESFYARFERHSVPPGKCAYNFVFCPQSEALAGQYDESTYEPPGDQCVTMPDPANPQWRKMAPSGMLGAGSAG